MSETHTAKMGWSTKVKAALGLAACLAIGGMARQAKAEDKQVDFDKDIKPILKESCIRCHQAPKGGPGGPGGGPGGPGPRSVGELQAGPGGGGPGGGRGPGGPGGGRGPRGPAAGFRLDDKAAALKGGKHGKAIIPGKAEESLMYQLLKGPVKKGDDEIAPMPKGKPGEDFKPLPDDQIELIKLWIDQGAKWGGK